MATNVLTSYLRVENRRIGGQEDSQGLLGSLRFRSRIENRRAGDQEDPHDSRRPPSYPRIENRRIGAQEDSHDS
jgi:hypothetical protein